MALAIVATVLAVSGGFRTTVGGFRISARSPLAASTAALLAGAAWLLLARKDRSIAGDLEAAWHALERNAARMAGVTALIAALVSSTFATRSAAGADASGYLSQAQMWVRTPLLHFDPLVTLDASLGGWLTTPLGWRPVHDATGDVESAAGLQAPTYPPGLPLLMALPHAIAGIDGAHAVVMGAAAAAVWATAMIAGGTAGVVAALILACSPVFLYQSFQLMSDVPVTAAWMLCFLLLRSDRSAWAGVAAAIAILVRPNLAPLVAVPLLIAPRKGAFATPVVVAGAALGVLQWYWYGSPIQSGYGSTAELFGLANVVPNAGRYFRWLIATAPVLLIAPFAFVRLRGRTDVRALMAFAVLVIGAYLIYGVFEHWSYLRFLLPAMAVFAIFAGVELAAWIGRWPLAIRFPMFFAVMLGIVAHGLIVARSLDTFRITDQLRRVGHVADAINHTAPAGAVIIAGEQSGAMRYYTGLSILRWEAATPDTLPGALERLLEAERPIYIALDAWEMELFRAKFPDVGPAALDWPPMLEAGSSHRTLAWNLADRWRYQLGQRINTVRIP
jgi:hypothetical protein